MSYQAIHKKIILVLQIACEKVFSYIPRTDSKTACKNGLEHKGYTFRKTITSQPGCWNVATLGDDSFRLTPIRPKRLWSPSYKVSPEAADLYKCSDTVDGRIPAPLGMYKTL